MQMTRVSVPIGAILGLVSALNIDGSSLSILVGTLLGGVVGGIIGLLMSRMQQSDSSDSEET